MKLSHGVEVPESLQRERTLVVDPPTVCKRSPGGRQWLLKHRLAKVVQEASRLYG